METSLICFGSWNWALSQIKLPARRRSCARAWPASVCQLLLICARALDQIRFSAPKGSMLLALPMTSRARPCAVSGEDGSETFSASILQTEGDWLRMRCRRRRGGGAAGHVDWRLVRDVLNESPMPCHRGIGQDTERGGASCRARSGGASCRARSF